MPEKGMQKVWKVRPKCNPNGSQNRLTIKKYAKRCIAKSMLKFNAEKSDGTFSDLAFWIEFLAV